MPVLSSAEAACNALENMVSLAGKKGVDGLTEEKGFGPEALMSALGALWLGLFPLWQDGSYTRITRAKWQGMLTLSGVTVAAVLIIVILLASHRQGRKLRLHPAQGIALAYLAWLGLSALFGSLADSINDSGQLTVLMGARRHEGLATQACYVGLFLLMSLHPLRLRPVMRIAALGLLAYAAVVALQYEGRNPFGLFPGELSIRTNYEFQGTIGNIDMVSGYVCLVMPVLLFSFALRRTGWLCLAAGSVGVLLTMMMEVQSGQIALAAVLAALVVVAMLRPETRCRCCLTLACALVMISLRLMTALPWHDGTEEIVWFYALSAKKLLPLAAAAVLAGLGLAFSRRPGRTAPGWLIAALGAALAVAMVAALLFANLPEGSGLWELQEVLHGRAQDGFGSERLGIWRMTVGMARENLLFGTGPDTFWYAMQQYQARTGQGLQQNFDNPHNMLLAVLSGSGVPALLLYLALMTVVAVMCLRAARRDPWPLALLAGLAAYQLQGLFTFSICLVSPMFWVMLGMAVSQTCRQEETTYADEL